MFFPKFNIILCYLGFKKIIIDNEQDKEKKNNKLNDRRDTTELVSR